jgi:hypothetical protein
MKFKIFQAFLIISGLFISSSAHPAKINFSNQAAIKGGAVFTPYKGINELELQTSQFSLADKFLRTELYFGTDKPGGGKVTAEDWDKFLETEVTPRFPEGFTVLEGYGQFKDSEGRIVREASLILVLFFPKKERRVVNLKVEELREKYKKQFNQESVLRVDYLKSINVKF